MDKWTKAIQSKDEMAILQAGLAFGEAIGGLRDSINEQRDNERGNVEMMGSKDLVGIDDALLAMLDRSLLNGVRRWTNQTPECDLVLHVRGFLRFSYEPDRTRTLSRSGWRDSVAPRRPARSRLDAPTAMTHASAG
jgi:hypothetical protein